MRFFQSKLNPHQLTNDLIPQPTADRGLLQVDQAEHRHQDVVGLFRKRSEDAPMGGHLRLSGRCKD